MDVHIRTAIGEEIADYIEPLASLRIAIFREYPYLYDGNLDYESRYLRDYARHSTSVCVLVFHGQDIVGASTAMRLLDAAPEFQQPFMQHQIPLDDIFYLGESVLFKSYRGRGIGKHFFEQREQQGRALGAKTCAFCAVDRPVNHPLIPPHYRDLSDFWRSRGYQPYPNLQAHLAWPELDHYGDSDHRLTFWLKHL